MPNVTHTFTVVIVPADEGGWTVSVAEIPGANSQGETLAEAFRNIGEAAAMILVTP